MAERDLLLRTTALPASTCRRIGELTSDQEIINDIAQSLFSIIYPNAEPRQHIAHAWLAKDPNPQNYIRLYDQVSEIFGHSLYAKNYTKRLSDELATHAAANNPDVWDLAAAIIWPTITQEFTNTKNEPAPSDRMRGVSEFATRFKDPHTLQTLQKLIGLNTAATYLIVMDSTWREFYADLASHADLSDPTLPQRATSRHFALPLDLVRTAIQQGPNPDDITELVAVFQALIAQIPVAKE